VEWDEPPAEQGIVRGGAPGRVTNSLAIDQAQEHFQPRLHCGKAGPLDKRTPRPGTCFRWEFHVVMHVEDPAGGLPVFLLYLLRIRLDRNNYITYFSNCKQKKSFILK
jgi:hypothetical protein